MEKEQAHSSKNKKTPTGRGKVERSLSGEEKLKKRKKHKGGRRKKEERGHTP